MFLSPTAKNALDLATWVQGPFLSPLSLWDEEHLVTEISP